MLRGKDRLVGKSANFSMLKPSRLGTYIPRRGVPLFIVLNYLVSRANKENKTSRQVTKKWVNQEFHSRSYPSQFII